MKKLLPLLMVFGVFLGSVGESFALPPCPGSYSSNTWTDCIGTYIDANGNKYVGEFRDGKRHGQGTHTYDPDRKYVGEWKDDKYHGKGTFYMGLGELSYKEVGEWKNGNWVNGEKIYDNPDLKIPVPKDFGL